MNELSEFRKDFIKRLKAARETAQLTQNEVADLLGMERSTYTNVETGRNALSIDNLIRLPSILHRSVNYFLGIPEELSADEDEMLMLYRSLPPDSPLRSTALQILWSLVVATDEFVQRRHKDGNG